MEYLGVALVVASGYVLAFVTQRGKGEAERERDTYKVATAAMVGEIDRAHIKISALAKAKRDLEHVAFNSGADPRNLMRVARERLLPDANASGGAHPDLLRPDDSDADGAGDPRVSPGERLLGHLLGDARGGLRSEGGPVDGRGPDVHGGDGED